MKQPFDLWGQRGWAGQEVAGEAHYAKEIRKLFGAQFKPDGSEIMVTAQLIPEPQNRHDRNAVSVRCSGTVLGYLPREDAARYVRVLSGLVEQGLIPQVTARVWAGERSTYDYDRRDNLVEGTEFVGSVRIDLAEPHMLVPANLPPDGLHAMLPLGQAIQVTGEEGHMGDLTPLLSSDGECWIYATLHELVEQTARTTRTVVEVRVDGAPVGKLTPKMSSELLPAVRHVAELGAQTADTASKEQGTDIVARRGGQRLYVEVKGLPSKSYADPRRANEVKRTQPTLQAKHWYADALLKVLRLREMHPEDRVAMAFPAKPRYRSLLAETATTLRTMRIDVILVDEDGEATEWKGL